MIQLCACQQLKVLKVEADIGADPLWCAKYFSNLDCEDFSLTEPLTKALFDWVSDYGTWIDWQSDGVVAGGVELEAIHNARGVELTELVKQELTQFDVIFSPSTYAARNQEV